jgi:hypothetical protein
MVKNSGCDSNPVRMPPGDTAFFPQEKREKEFKEKY